jgi:hypothetical protein
MVIPCQERGASVTENGVVHLPYLHGLVVLKYAKTRPLPMASWLLLGQTEVQRIIPSSDVVFQMARLHASLNIVLVTQ